MCRVSRDQCPMSLSAWVKAGCVLVLLSVLGTPAVTCAQQIAILQSANIPSYNQAIQGFKSVLPDTATFSAYDVQGDIERGRKLARKIRASDATLVLAVGGKAALIAKLEIIDIPVVFCMVLDPAMYGLNTSNMTGVSLQIPVDRQFVTMRAVLPQLKRIGVLYDPEKTAHAVDDARRQAKTLGLEFVARQIHTEKDVPATLRALMPHIEALWLVPDSTVLTEESLGFILSTALEASVPVIGFSSELVRSGALIGLSVNYEDVGRQASLLAQQILKGRAIPSQKAISPDRVRLALNLKVARVLGITIPPEVVSRADEVY